MENMPDLSNGLKKVLVWLGNPQNTFVMTDEEKWQYAEAEMTVVGEDEMLVGHERVENLVTGKEISGGSE